MFHLDATTVLLIHEDRVKHLQKVHEPLLIFRGWKFWRKAKQTQDTAQAIPFVNLSKIAR
jgi:hypothetical protein